MSDMAENSAMVAEARNMTDEELIDTWETASDQETENLSRLLQAVVGEMEKRGIGFG